MANMEISSFEIQSLGELRRRLHSGHFGLHKKGNIPQFSQSIKKESDADISDPLKKGIYPEFSESIKREHVDILESIKKGIYPEFSESIKKEVYHDVSDNIKRGCDLNGRG